LLITCVGCLDFIDWRKIVGLGWLTLGAILLDVRFVAGCNSKRQRDGCGCKHDKSRYFFGQKPS
jgi:hypothetical protein